MKKLIAKFLNQDKKYLIIEGVIALLVIGLIIGLIIVLNKPKKVAKPQENNKQKEDYGDVSIIDVNSKSRPIAVMINNASDARPLQKGMQEAFIVYEMINYADGTTRFLALFKDKNVPEIGPIRSARHYHLDYVLENDAIYVHWGYSPKAQTDIKSLGINNINGLTYGSNSSKENISGNSFFWTEPIANLSIAHRRFTSMELLNKAIDKLKYKKETDQENLLTYTAKELDVDKMSNTKDANKVEIHYSKSNYSTYDYDSTKKVYLRSVKGVAHKDAAIDKQLEVKNILVYKVKNVLLAGDTESRQDLKNIGTGTGYYITDGKAIDIKWSKECRECQTKYTYEDGSEVIFNDGNTFIQIQPENQDLIIS